MKYNHDNTTLRFTHKIHTYVWMLSSADKDYWNHDQWIFVNILTVEIMIENYFKSFINKCHSGVVYSLWYYHLQGICY